MINIGILGSDNGHALAFAKLCNIADANGEYAYPDVRVSAIYGFNDSKEHTLEVAKEGAIPFVAESPEDFVGKVDAVMVVYRDGKYHLAHILPFIKLGYPVSSMLLIFAKCACRYLVMTPRLFRLMSPMTAISMW